MWRAYGGIHPVAIVFNTTAFHSDTDAFKAYTGKVKYHDKIKLEQEINALTIRMRAESEFIRSRGEEHLMNCLYWFFRNYVICMKHPGFSEELEWRVFYTPGTAQSSYMISSIETINGLPQEVHKIPLKNIPEENFLGASPQELINKIIIGPCDQPLVVGKAFIRKLEFLGCHDPSGMVSYSLIPLRQR